MALKAPSPPTLGSDLPRLGVDIDPAPVEELRQDARTMGIDLIPAQEYVLGIAEATNADGQFLFREVCDVEARQNGKSTKLAPLIRNRMRKGMRVLHSAQDRIIPRRIYERVATSFPKGQARIRMANGQEEIILPNGGRYKIVAPKRGIRGNDADLLILDEIREQEDWEFTFAARPTVAASDNPQIVYLSNAGSEVSVVLNDLKARAGKDPKLAYLEWSADPELDPGDVEGWKQANPGLGRVVDLDTLDWYYQSYRESGNMAGWETEHLCRWVLSMAPRLVTDADWTKCRRSPGRPENAYMGVSVDPGGRRASAALSWPLGDGSIGLMVLADVTGDPVNVDRFGPDLVQSAREATVQAVAFDPVTDAHLARYFPNAQPIAGQLFTNASERFVRAVETGQVQWEWAEEIGRDLPYVARKSVGPQAFQADRADPKRPITAVLAAIRAVWMAAEPNTGVPSVY